VKYFWRYVSRKISKHIAKYVSVPTEVFQVELCTTNRCRCFKSLLLTYPTGTAEW